MAKYKEKKIAEKEELIETICPMCRFTKIISFPKEKLPICPKCGSKMAIKELLDEGKSY